MFELIAIGAILIGEGHFVVLHRFDPVIGYGHPMGVAPQIVEHLFGTCKGAFGVNDPILFLKPGNEFAKRCRTRKLRRLCR
jgi:hypothetical protein